MADGTKEYPRRRDKDDNFKSLQARGTNAQTDVQASKKKKNLLNKQAEGLPKE